MYLMQIARFDRWATQFPFFCYFFPSKWGKFQNAVFWFLYAINAFPFDSMKIEWIICEDVIGYKYELSFRNYLKLFLFPPLLSIRVDSLDAPPRWLLWSRTLKHKSAHWSSFEFGVVKNLRTQFKKLRTLHLSTNHGTAPHYLTYQFEVEFFEL